VSPARSLRFARPRTAARLAARVSSVALAITVISALTARGVDAHEPQSAAYTTYITRAGDSLYDFASRYLRHPGDWVPLARLNHVSEPRRLQPGIALHVPVALLRRNRLTATVIATSGRASHAARSMSPQPLVVGTMLAEGARVETGENGFATLEFADGTHLVIPPNSAIELDTLRQTALTGTTDRIIKLRNGQVDSEVTHATKKDDRFQIRAPSVVAGVRGTAFRVAYDGDQGSTAVEVLDGAVGVDAAATGRTAPAPGARLADSAQLVTAHHGSLTARDGAIGAPVALLDAPSLAHPRAVQDGPSVMFDVVPMQDARGYRVQIGRDAGLLDLIGDVRATSPTIDAGPLDDGTYFVRITAIDASGLEGMPNIYAFDRQGSALGASGGRIDGSRAYRFRWSPDRREPLTRFRFILATTPDLRMPLVDRPDIMTGEVVVDDLPMGVYYWTVLAERFDNGHYQQKASPVRSFRLDW
jgi:hypothetical protein